MLELDLDKRAVLFLERMHPKHAGQIIRKLESLCRDPYPQDSKLLKGLPLYRADSGEYRIVYSTEGAFLRVYLIGKRNDGEEYRKLGRFER